MWKVWVCSKRLNRRVHCCLSNIFWKKWKSLKQWEWPASEQGRSIMKNWLLCMQRQIANTTSLGWPCKEQRHFVVVLKFLQFSHTTHLLVNSLCNSSSIFFWKKNNTDKKLRTVFFIVITQPWLSWNSKELPLLTVITQKFLSASWQLWQE